MVRIVRGKGFFRVVLNSCHKSVSCPICYERGVVVRLIRLRVVC